MNVLLPWLGVLGAIVFFGTFAVPMKLNGSETRIHPIVFQVYVALGVFLSSLPLIFFGNWEWNYFTYLGFLSALMWSIAMMFCATAVDLLGVSVGQGIWSGCNAVTAFVESIAFGDKLGDPSLATVGLVLLVAGVVGLALVGGKTDNSRQIAVDSETATMNLALPTGIDSQDSQRQSKPRSLAVLGVIVALSAGVLAGSIFIPLRYTQLHGVDQVFFSVSFGVGAMLSVCAFLLLQIGLQLCGCVAPLGAWDPQNFAWPGLACGVLWNLGNICSIFSLQPPLGMGVGYPLTQSCILVSGIWGVAYFKEIQGLGRVLMFFCFALLLLCGASILGIFGSAS